MEPAIQVRRGSKTQDLKDSRAQREGEAEDVLRKSSKEQAGIILSSSYT